MTQKQCRFFLKYSQTAFFQRNKNIHNVIKACRIEIILLMIKEQIYNPLVEEKFQKDENREQFNEWRKPQEQYEKPRIKRGGSLRFGKSGSIYKQRLRNAYPLEVSTPKPSVKADIHSSFEKTQNKLALSLMGIKRHSNSSIGTSPSAKNPVSQEKQNSSSTLPFSPERIRKWKAEISQIKQHEKHKNIIPRPSSKPVTEERNQKRQVFYPELRQIENTEIVNCQTPLSKLKILLTSINNSNHISIEVPYFFLNPPQTLTHLSPDPETLQTQMQYLFITLGIPVFSLSIRRYTNCIVISNHSLCVVWHQAGRKRYFGGWKSTLFDQGVKNGMGIQWVPNKYVYYGEFANNKRHGLGIMRANSREEHFGYWKNGNPQYFIITKNKY